jgi:hypothetical protein
MSINPRHCCDCGVQLAKPTARYCPEGHPQFDESAALRLGNCDRHPDDDDDDELQVVSGANFQPNLRAKLPIEAVQNLRAKAIARDSNQKASDKRQGSYGIRPSNDNSVKQTVVVWLCERPPVKPQQLGISLVKRIDLSLHLTSAESVNTFVRGIISSFPAFNDHQDISTGALVIDNSRLAYVGKIEGNSCAWWAIWEELDSVSD